MPTEEHIHVYLKAKTRDAKTELWVTRYDTKPLADFCQSRERSAVGYEGPWQANAKARRWPRILVQRQRRRVPNICCGAG